MCKKIGAKSSQNIIGNNVNGDIHQVNIQINSASLNTSDFATILGSISGQSALLSSLIKEKIVEIKNYISNFQASKAIELLDAILEHGLQGLSIPLVSQVYYLKAMTQLKRHNSHDISEYIEKLKANDADDKCIADLLLLKEMHSGALNLQNASDNSFSDIEFTEHYMEALIDQSPDIVIEKFSSIELESARYWYFLGIAYFNTQDFINAQTSFEKANSIKNDTRFQALITYSNARHKILHSEYFSNEELQEAKQSLYELRTNKNPLVNEQPLLFYSNLLDILFVTSDEAIVSEYSNLDDSLKNIPELESVIGNYYLAHKEWEIAIEYFKKAFEVKPSEELFINILIARKESENFKAVVSCFNQHKNAYCSPAIVGIYLHSLKKSNERKFKKEYKKYCIEYENNANFLFHIIFSRALDTGTQKQKIQEIVPVCKELGNPFQLLHLAQESYDLKMFDEAISFLNAIDNPPPLVAEKMVPLAHMLERKDIVCRIVDQQISEGRETVYLLKAKAQVLAEENKHVESLEVNKTIFTKSPSHTTAQIVLSLLIHSPEFSKREAEPYLEYLQNDSDTPLSLLWRAITYSKLGEHALAQSLAYKSIFLLNNEIQADIFNLFLQWHFNNTIFFNGQQINFSQVRDNSVVFLQEVSTNNVFIVCLNSEDSFCDGRISIGALHAEKASEYYLKLINKPLNHNINLAGKVYMIKEIIDKNTHAFRYVLSQIDSLPVEDRIVQKIAISEDNPLENLMKLLPNDHLERSKILDLYHFKNNDIGLPIETIARETYDNYIHAIRFLLLEQGQLFYAGEINHIINFGSLETKIVITLPTLVLLAVLNKLSLLDTIRDRVLIPVSLKTFLNDRIREASNADVVSPGRLAKIDDNITLIEADKTLTDIWTNIYLAIEHADTEEIINKDRIASEHENIFHLLHLHLCQLDCIILSKKHNAIYLCDDLVLRKLYRMITGQNNDTNMTSLIFANESIEADMLDLSKTNYLYLPKGSYLKPFWQEALNGFMNSPEKTTMYLKYFIDSIGYI